MDAVIGIVGGLVIIGAGLYMAGSDRVQAARGNLGRAMFGRPDRAEPSRLDRADGVIRGTVIVACGLLLVIASISQL